MRGRLLLPSLLAVGLLGCRDDIDYGYFAVKVSVDPSATPEYLMEIASCGVNVDGADVDFGSLACAEGRFTTHELGTFEWSTDTQGGTVEFTVTLKNAIGRLWGTGKSTQVAISPGNMVPATVVVTPAPGTLMPP
jgi:hypothetical protein